jgi:hypothetical protein
VRADGSRFTLLLLATALCAGLTACAGGNDKAAAVDSGPPIVADTATSIAHDCPVTGHWSRCLILRRIEQAGLTVRRESLTVIHESPLTIDGLRLPIARGEIHLFIYADSAMTRRDMARLDMTQFVMPDAEPDIRRRTLVRSDNVLVLMNVANGANNERIGNAVMAGPPQPARHR